MEDLEKNLVNSFFQKAGIDLVKFPLLLDQESETKGSFDPNNELDYDKIIAKAKYNDQENKEVLFCINNAVPEKIEENQVFRIILGNGEGIFSVELSLHHNSDKIFPIYLNGIAQENYESKLSQIKFYRNKKNISHTSYVKMRFGDRYLLLPYLFILA